MANDALILFIIMLGCVLIAAAICWFIWGKACNALEIELSTVRRATENELAELSQRYDDLLQSGGNEASELGRSEEERKSLQTRCAQLGQELKDVTGQLAEANSQVVELRLRLEAVTDNLQLHEAAVVNSPQDVTDAAHEQLNAVQSELADLIIDRDDWRGRYQNLEADYKEHGHGANTEELNRLRAQLAQTMEHSRGLEAQLAAKGEPPADDKPAVDPVPEPAKPDAKAETLERIAARSSELDLERIGRGEEEQRDDLTQIKGIGPFVERKLNALGIFNLQQIAGLTATDEDLVNDIIEFFPGRIRRDDWVGQARQLKSASDASGNSDTAS